MSSKKYCPVCSKEIVDGKIKFPCKHPLHIDSPRNIHDYEFYFLGLKVIREYGDFSDDILNFHRENVIESFKNTPHALSDYDKSILCNDFLKFLLSTGAECVSVNTKIIENFIIKNFSDVPKDIFKIVIHPLSNEINIDDINLDKITEILNKRNEIMESCSSSNLKISICVNQDNSISYD